jgi:hypothetical protein
MQALQAPVARQGMCYQGFKGLISRFQG